MNTPHRIGIIEEIISKASNVSITDMRSHRRDRDLSDARAAVWMISKDLLKYPYTTLGRLYKRDHSTIISGCQRLRKLKISKKILDEIKKIYPEISNIPTGSDETKSIGNWNF